MHHIEATITLDPSFSIHAFIDDILVRSTNKQVISDVFSYFDTTARHMGLNMNIKKTELHAMNNAQHTVLSTPTGTTIATFNSHHKPHSFYKYLGVFIFTNPDPALLQQLIMSEIQSFFSNLSPIPLLLHEYVLLYNTQLIPILCYRMLMHSLPLSSIQSIESTLWQSFAKAAGISSVTSPKDRYVTPSQGGLGLHHFGLSLHKQTVNNVLRHLHHDSPPSCAQSVTSAVYASTPNPVQDSFVDACHYLLINTNGIGPWNVSLAKDLPKNTDIYTHFNNSFHVGRVHSSTPTSSTLCFQAGETYRVLDKHTFHQKDPSQPLLPSHLLSHDSLFPAPLSKQTPIPTSSAPPHRSSISQVSNQYVTIDFAYLQLHLPAQDLQSWGCLHSYEVVQSSSPSDWFIYLDGSATGDLFGSAAAFSTPTRTFALASSSPLRSSFGAEFWALVTVLRYLSQIQPTEPHSVHLFGDNQAVVDLYNLAQRHTTISTHHGGSEIKFIQSILPDLHPHLRVSMTWIKSHVGFQGNELADSIAKWAAFFLPTPQMPPPPNGSISFGPFPVLGKITSSYPPPLCNSYALVIATVGVGTVLIWYLI